MVQLLTRRSGRVSSSMDIDLSMAARRVVGRGIAEVGFGVVVGSAVVVVGLCVVVGFGVGLAVGLGVCPSSTGMELSRTLLIMASIEFVLST